MNEEAHAKRRREAELDQLTSPQLADLITAAGWCMMGRQNKANRRAAVLYLEQYPVAECIVDKLKLVRLDAIDMVLESVL